MAGENNGKVIKKTVALHPIMDNYVRKTWAMLIDEGHDATYSSALNFMLLLAIVQASERDGLSDETKDVIWAFAQNRELINALHLEDDVSKLKEMWGNHR
ncbi:MAG: hypothetical protein V3S51_03055 [Dehalococcoidia bacterium]